LDAAAGRREGETERGVGGEGKGSGVSVRGGKKQATPREIDR
jgi:hypothetical protein